MPDMTERVGDEDPLRAEHQAFDDEVAAAEAEATPEELSALDDLVTELRDDVADAETVQQIAEGTHDWNPEPDDFAGDEEPIERVLPTGGVFGVAQEDLKPGELLEIDTSTGMVRKAHAQFAPTMEGMNKAAHVPPPTLIDHLLKGADHVHELLAAGQHVLREFQALQGVLADITKES